MPLAIHLKKMRQLRGPSVLLRVPQEYPAVDLLAKHAPKAFRLTSADLDGYSLRGFLTDRVGADELLSTRLVGTDLPLAPLKRGLLYGVVLPGPLLPSLHLVHGLPHSLPLDVLLHLGFVGPQVGYRLGKAGNR